MTHSQAGSDPFIGVWLLQPEQSHYTFGQAPQSGRYIIESTDHGYLVTMEWVDPDGQDTRIQYEAVPDGKEYPDASGMADSVSMTRVDAQTLDSEARSGGQAISHARRILSDDGQEMTVIQSNITPSGKALSNRAVYRRQP
jgi:hypothetical protein